ncbi:Piwi-domain-containing protein [Sistotremastrum suecicum HHB10207 ss-3]|uniref:Piwi-domain-containing protein n=1 Tax=Sistotremastrum suecicum HHB10207 ss-3 TaxID=1314776 RepID=A0A166GPI3_9AGAM|nr:Piwi-domain-containing protein [Sistotremastrum suecicum HHB10207 ss-3]
MAYRGPDGTPYRALTNMFKIEGLPKGIIYHYDVAFDPPPSGRHFGRQKLINRLQIKHANVFEPICPFDGMSSLFSLKRLSLGAIATFQIGFSDGVQGRPPPKQTEIIIRQVNDIDTKFLGRFLQSDPNLTENEYNQALLTILYCNVVLRQAPVMIHPHTPRAIFVEHGRQELGGGLELWRGYAQSVRPVAKTLLVNLDVTATAMYQSGPLFYLIMSFVRDFEGIRNPRDLAHLSPRCQSALSKFLQGVKIQVTHLGTNPANKMGTIQDIVPEGSQFVFEKDGNEMTVQNYYHAVYDIQIQHPNIIAVHLQSGAVVPIELCVVVPGQMFRGQLPQESRPKMLAFSSDGPERRLRSIMEAGNIFKYDTSPFVREAGIQVAKIPLQVDGHLLRPPTIHLAANQTMTPNDGQWNIRNFALYQPAQIGAWVVVIYDSRFTDNDAAGFCQQLTETAKQFSLRFYKSTPPVMHQNGQGNISQQLQAANQMALNEGAPGARSALIIVILPPAADDLYAAVKHYGDVVHGFPTQCLIGEKCKKGLVNRNAQYCKNVLLKINVKQDGTNFTSSEVGKIMKKAPSMVIGADVSHPGPGSTLPSMSAVVGSVDANGTKFVASSNIQQARVEQIVDLASSIEYLLEMFKKFQAVQKLDIKCPQKIYFFRDGISEGEFLTTGIAEIADIKVGIETFMAKNNLTGHKPTFTYVVVGKRHHVRFFPQNGQQGQKNAPAGFIVDNVISTPNTKIKDWYLLSHNGRLGTSRPSHYTVLHDENAFTSDSLQSFCNGLCYNYARATSAVSIPTPVFYADLVCARARYHLSQGEGQVQGNQDDWKQINPKMAHRMYWV